MKVLVDNMTCEHCTRRIAKALQDNNIKDFHIDLETQTVHLGMAHYSVETAKQAIEGIGYHFKPVEEEW